MSSPITPTTRGWVWDTVNSRGGLYHNGTEIVRVTGSGASVTGTLSSSGALTVSSGGLTVTDGGLTVTAGGLTVTAGGLTVTAGAFTVSDTGSAHSVDGTNLSMPNLPTSDPQVAGQLWANSNVVTVSTGA